MRPGGAFADRKDALQGKRILITGADRGIGAALAVRYAEMGAHVCANLFAPVAKSEGLLAQLNHAGCKPTLVVPADVRDPDQIDAMFRAIADGLGGLDVLVNNAGVESIHAALELSADEWDRVLDTNLRGSFLCAQGAARLMKQQHSGGVILNISSIHDTVPRLGTVHYCASKAGLTMLTSALAQEWAEHGIRVVGLAPGAVETAINRAAITQIGRSKFEQWIPMGRLGSTDDICDAAVFLISDRASYISGTTLVVDGAYSVNSIQYDPRVSARE
jgi:glucose 1-dehydrogenase/3-dehydrosphinganine reductase